MSALSVHAGGEEDYDFKFAELGVDVGGDFGDAFQGLESLVFDVDHAEADGLDLGQDAGDFAGFATQAPLVGVIQKARSQMRAWLMRPSGFRWKTGRIGGSS